jgi:hypothetical protein
VRSAPNEQKTQPPPVDPGRRLGSFLGTRPTLIPLPGRSEANSERFRAAQATPALHEKARDWYDSPVYQPLLAIRQKTATSTLFIAEGLPK